MTDISHVDWHFNEFLAETSTLDPVDAGIYAIACAMICRRGGPIERADLKRFVKCHGRLFENALARLVAAGSLTLNGTEICAKWCVKELENARKRIVKWTENGAKGGRPSNKPNGLAEPGGFHACMTRAEPPITITEDKTLDPRGSKGADAPPPPSDFACQERSAQRHPPPERTPAGNLWDRGTRVLGEDARSLIGKARKQHGDLAVMEAIIACEHECASDPLEFFIGCLRERGFNGRQATARENLAIGAHRAAQAIIAKYCGDVGDDPPAAPALLDGYGYARTAASAVGGLA